MSLAPLLEAPLSIRIHAFAAIAALVIGIIQLARPKGTLPHRALGWMWVLLMAAVALSSFWIHTIHQFGDWSLIHVLSIVTLVALPFAVLHARRHRVAAHRSAMIALFGGALVVAGIFTFLPGRIMHEVATGAPHDAAPATP
jgi:uncharacterized membrane protein